MRFFEFKTTLIEATGISWGKIAGEQYEKTRLPNFLDFKKLGINFIIIFSAKSSAQALGSCTISLISSCGNSISKLLICLSSLTSLSKY